MFKRVDVENEVFEGFAYLNMDSEFEYVEINVRDFTEISIKDGTGDDVAIYTKDISKLIKALQAAEAYWKEQE